jgi:hypothetical protein
MCICLVYIVQLVFLLKSFEMKLFCFYWKENSSWRSPSNSFVPTYRTEGHTSRSFSLLDAGCRLTAAMAAQLARLLRHVVCSGGKISKAIGTSHMKATWI